MGKKSLTKLKADLDKVFSLYIRQKDADENGMVSCYTCGVVKHWKELHCGHFISRRHLATRWDEMNTAPQCPGCNLFNQGNAPAFALRLIKEHGEKKVEELFALSKKTCKFVRYDYELMIEKYTSLLVLLQR